MPVNLNWQAVTPANPAQPVDAYKVVVTDNSSYTIWEGYYGGTLASIPAGILSGATYYRWCIQAYSARTKVGNLFEFYPDLTDLNKDTNNSAFSLSYTAVDKGPDCVDNSQFWTFQTAGAPAVVIPAPSSPSAVNVNGSKAVFPLAFQWGAPSVTGNPPLVYKWQITGTENGRGLTGLFPISGPAGGTSLTSVPIPQASKAVVRSSSAAGSDGYYTLAASSGFTVKGSYVFEVRACLQSDLNTCGPFASYNFTLGLKAFNLTSPSGSATPPFSLTWEGVPGADSYQWFATGLTGETITANLDSTTPAKVSSTPLTTTGTTNVVIVGRNYAWQVNAMREGQSFPSQTTNFSFVVLAPGSQTCEQQIGIWCNTGTCNGTILTASNGDSHSGQECCNGTCSSSGGCTAGQVRPHKECSGTACVSVDSCGVNSCAADIDCSAPGHPAAPTGLSPTGGTTVSGNAILSWQLSPVLSSGYFEGLLSDLTGGNYFPIRTDYNVTSWNPSANSATLSPGDSYEWYVRACKTSASVVTCGNYSTLAHFTVSDAPVLISPAPNAQVSKNPTFTWMPVSGGIYYQIKVSGPSPQDTIAISTHLDLAANNIDLSPGSYTWQVRGSKDMTTWGEWSVLNSFTVSSSPNPNPGPNSNPSSSCTTTCPDNAICNPLKACNLEEFIGSIINFIFYIGIALAPLMFLWAGFYFLTAGGDPKKVDTAKHIMLYAAIGLIVILLAKVLVVVVKNIIGA
jgi:hypothetical protein